MALLASHSPLPLVLCVDDDGDIRRVVRHSLELAGMACVEVGSAAEALEWIARNGLPDVAVVDIRMPGMSGLELCSHLHVYSDLPIVLLTAVDDEPTMVHSIETFAEDYVLKPFRPGVLVARIRRLLRRTIRGPGPRGAEQVVDDRLAFRFHLQEAVVDGAVVSLTATETKLLYVLYHGAPRAVRTAHLLARMWPREEVFEDTLRVHVHRLRQKLEPDPGRPRYLVTERGVGYRWVGNAATAGPR